MRHGSGAIDRPATGAVGLRVGRQRASFTWRLGAALLAVVWMIAPSSTEASQPRIGERLYVVLLQHNPAQFSNALKAADEFLAVRPGRGFEIIMDYYGMFAAIPGVTTAQRDYGAIKGRNPGLTVVVCRETLDALRRSNKRRISVLPGMKVLPCKGRRDMLERDGWRPALGF